MIVRIRQFCCALMTFVRLVSVFFLVFHILLAVAAAIWYILRISQKSVENGVIAAGEVDDRTFDDFLIGENEKQRGSAAEENADLEAGNLDLIIGDLLSTHL